MFSSLNLLCVDAVYVYFILFFLCNLFLPRVFPYFPLLLYPFFYVYNVCWVWHPGPCRPGVPGGE